MSFDLKKLLIPGIAYLAFVVYGSLVPLTFRAMPFDEALRSFLQIRYLELGIASRADWVANILLFIPLTFLWLGSFWSVTGKMKQFLVATTVLLSAILLSASIEFMQLYFPPRTVSLNDILAESIGALCGIILWCLAGSSLVRWCTEWAGHRLKSNPPAKLLFLYLFGLIFYSLLPLDLTISPVEIYHKWKAGRVILNPFTTFSMASPLALYNLLSDMVIWLPVGFLAVYSGIKRPWQAFFWVIMAALTLEFLQLFVYTRVSDLGDLLTAACGALPGIWLGKRYLPSKDRVQDEMHITIPKQVFAFICVMLWVIVLVVLFWYPFNFNLERQFIADRLPQLMHVPFYHYYFGTEYRAITELLHKTMFFAPLGALIAFMFGAAHAKSLFARIIALFCCVTVALTIELGQVALPSKIPDSTDLLLEVLGGCFGFWVAALTLQDRLTVAEGR